MHLVGGRGGSPGREIRSQNLFLQDATRRRKKGHSEKERGMKADLSRGAVQERQRNHFREEKKTATPDRPAGKAKEAKSEMHR